MANKEFSEGSLKIMDWHAQSSADVIKTLKTNEKNGLSSAEAKKRLEKYGKNRLHEPKKPSLFAKFIAQFSDFMVLILLAAAGVSFVTAIIEGTGDFIDPIMILLIVLINAVTGVIQENRAEKAIEALKRLSAPHAKVIRDGKEKSILSEEVVPGDILVLETGDILCCDARIISEASLKSEESSLTGEAVPSEKSADIICEKSAPIGDRHNMLFSTGIISSGNALAVVVETGMRTQVGKIAKMINDEESPKTPLQKSLAKTGKMLGIGAIAICIIIFVLGLLQQIPPLNMFMISISLAVAAIPEGLPAVVTIVLALGIKKMAARRAIVRRMPAVETLGRANVICSDKTGTLTQNRMTVTRLELPKGSASFNSPEGVFALSLCTLCNNSRINSDGTASGDPTEGALVLVTLKAGRKKEKLEQELPRVKEFPFDSTRKRMTTVHKLKNGGYRIITKGAPDMLLPLCSASSDGRGMTEISRKAVISKNEAMASDALRVLAVAYRDTATIPKTADEAEKGLIFTALIGMIDPPRPEAKHAVARCKTAGIKPVMITGDHIATAKAIAKDLGIFSGNDKAMTGVELDKISDEDLKRNIFSYSVFARVSPEHKVRIVKAFRSASAVVAMTGDGVNDAPALKAADIGCAMGITGTDVAKGAADMILTDDNFSTIVEAVSEGRGIYENIKKTVHFLLSSNIGEIITVFTAFLLRLPSPLFAIQLLWVNLVTDSLPALALGVEPIPQDIMERKPNDAKKSLFADGMIFNIAIEGCFIGALSFLAFTIGRVFFDNGGEPVVGRTMTFASLSLCQLIHAFNIKSEQSIFKGGLFTNPKLILSFIIGVIMQVSVISIPALATIFKAVPLSPVQWLIVAGLSFIPLVVVEIEKFFQHKTTKHKAPTLIHTKFKSTL